MNATKELNFSSLSRWQKPVDDGRTFCRKHPGSRYDPKMISSRINGHEIAALKNDRLCINSLEVSGAEKGQC